MTRLIRLACVTLIVLTAVTFPGAARPAAQPAQRALTAFTVDVVIARYQGEKRLSSLPYSLGATSTDNSPSRLRIGGQVPVATSTPAVDGKPGITSYNYRDIGTSIDASVTSDADGRFRVGVTIEETSVYTDATNPTSHPTGAPSFRSFRTNSALVLRDGQSSEFTAATDRMTGEVTKVTVKLTVMK